MLEYLLHKRGVEPNAAQTAGKSSFFKKAFIGTYYKSGRERKLEQWLKAGLMEQVPDEKQATGKGSRWWRVGWGLSRQV